MPANSRPLPTLEAVGRPADPLTLVTGPPSPQVLSGCGVYDGTELHEASSILVHLSRGGAEVQIFAPDVPQMHVIDHIKGQPSEGETRNVLTESARIARGKITDLAKLTAVNHDAAIFPGGFGAAKNLSTFAVDGGTCKVNRDVERVLKEFHQAGKPIGTGYNSHQEALRDKKWPCHHQTCSSGCPVHEHPQGAPWFCFIETVVLERMGRVTLGSSVRGLLQQLARLFLITDGVGVQPALCQASAFILALQEPLEACTSTSPAELGAYDLRRRSGWSRSVLYGFSALCDKPAESLGQRQCSHWLCGVEMPCSWPLSGLPLGCRSGSSALFVESQQLAGWSRVFAEAAQSVPEAPSRCCCRARGGCTSGGTGWRWTPDHPGPACGCFSITCVHEAHVDQKNKVVTTPAFMCDTALHHIHDGIGAMVRKVLELTGR
ncbi:PREDICTED: ES1 protein homolog, mitochondrial [Bison bison bison]|uniref:ES1 protein homolog, mitochondrial n=1 Tax=Bison bison bison TaxID=43346 RepID=A0A6P3GUH4_BISBB|nr:PREDICTED: ES1 protein homolog, mitochondrial [Bison bison bison]